MYFNICRGTFGSLAMFTAIRKCLVAGEHEQPAIQCVLFRQESRIAAAQKQLPRHR